ncbi:inverse autotransporter beta domain-containing protein, partial [Salmonella enterica]
MFTVWVVWLNIAMQILFPLAGVFTPVIAHAQRQSLETGRTTSRTQVYTLGKGESVQSVARKYNLTIAELRELNQLRTFAHGFSALKVGDELDVPYKPDVKASLNNNKKSPQNTIDSGEQKVAQVASQAGSFLANSPDSNAAAGMARGMAAGAASSSVQQWLSQFGTARIQLDADDNFSLKNSQLDLLVPLWERKDKLVFTQGSIHRTDERMQSNLGLGMRYFGSDYMIGGNTFLDYDLSRSHARSGLGVEYGRDYLKLAANGYLRLTGWKDSDDVEDYEERPANGWDVRAEGWLPAMPQLGGKLTYEQYYGDEVALFGKDNRQRDPHAITAGLNYTPVPLLTLSAEQRQGQDGKSDTRFGLEMNYQLGVPWVHQVDPESVAALRSLDGARYDLVERNNNIVLEYRKKEVIRLKTADLITGYAGEQKSLGVSVESRHGVRQIDWSAPALLAAGGKIVGSGMDYSVVLPAYQYGDAAVNTYMVTATAVDQKGNRSDQSETQVTVNASEISTGYSTFKPRSASSDLTLPADGASTGVLVLILENNQQQPVDVPADELKLAIDTGPLPRLGAVKGETVQKAKVSGFNRQSAGNYEVTVVAGTRDELLTLTPSVRNIKLSAAKVFIRKNTPDAGQSTFGASPKTIAADNTATSTLTFTAKDAGGNALTGVAASLNFAVTGSDGHAPAAGKVTVSSITETATAGVYTATLLGSLAGTYTVKPQFSGSLIGNLSDTVTLTAGTTPDAGQSVFGSSPKSVAADNTATSTLTLAAKDANGNAITGLAGSLSFAVNGSNGSTPAQDQVTVSSVTETATAGVYVATLKGVLADTYTVKPQFNGSAMGTLSDTVTLTAGTTPDAGQSVFAASPKSIAANDSTISTLTFTAKDVNGNTLVGIAGSLSFAVTGSHGSVPTEGQVTISSVTETATAGVYTATLKGTLADTYTLKPLFSGSAIGSLSDTVTLTAGTTPDVNQSVFVASPRAIEADNVEISTLTLTVKDTFGNVITGIGNSLHVDITDSNGNHPAESSAIVSSVSESATPGVYTATLKGTHADTYTVRPQFNGSNIGSLNDTVILMASVIPDGSQSAFDISPKSIAADDATTSTLMLTVKDSNGNAIAGMAGNVSFSVTGSGGSAPAAGKITFSSVSETATPGVYTATLKGQLADTWTVQPRFRGSVISGLSSTVILTSGSTPDGTQSAFAASPKSIVADDVATSLLTFTAKDTFGNAIAGIAGNISFAVSDSGGSAPAAGKITVSSVTETATPGVYTATLKGQMAETYTLKPQFSSSNVGNLSDSVTLTSGSTPDDSQS